MKRRFEGRNLDEALENAARAFGVERYQLAYHVMLEKRGFLGGMKRVVIEADVNLSAAPQAEVEDERQPPSLAAGEPPSYAPAREPRRGRPERGRRRGRGGEPPRRQPPPPPRRQPRGPIEPAPEQTPQSEEARQVSAWCEELFDLANLELEARTEETDERILVRLYGYDSRLALGHGGELLDSLQVITTKALVGRQLQKPVEFDCQQFKERRAEELGRRARAVADQVRRDGREQMLEAMSPIERRIVHLALQDDGEVATESRGEGFYKRVAIVPRKEEEPSPVES
jgi:spoIIIJ-associated protein